MSSVSDVTALFANNGRVWVWLVWPDQDLQIWFLIFIWYSPKSVLEPINWAWKFSLFPLVSLVLLDHRGTQTVSPANIISEQFDVYFPAFPRPHTPHYLWNIPGPPWAWFCWRYLPSSPPSPSAGSQVFVTSLGFTGQRYSSLDLKTLNSLRLLFCKIMKLILCRHVTKFVCENSTQRKKLLSSKLQDSLDENSNLMSQTWSCWCTAMCLCCFNTFILI